MTITYTTGSSTQVAQFIIETLFITLSTKNGSTTQIDTLTVVYYYGKITIGSYLVQIELELYTNTQRTTQMWADR